MRGGDAVQSDLRKLFPNSYVSTCVPALAAIACGCGGYCLSRVAILHAPVCGLKLDRFGALWFRRAKQRARACVCAGRCAPAAALGPSTMRTAPTCVATMAKFVAAACASQTPAQSASGSRLRFLTGRRGMVASGIRALMLLAPRAPLADSCSRPFLLNCGSICFSLSLPLPPSSCFCLFSPHPSSPSPSSLCLRLAISSMVMNAPTQVLFRQQASKGCTSASRTPEGVYAMERKREGTRNTAH